MAESSALNRQRFPRPQFSLRLLLLLFTALAIGFPIWYRWPYEQEMEFAIPKSLFDPFDTLEDPFAPTPPAATTITTWQRQWGGGRLKHGVERQIGPGGSRFTTYRLGKRHGPYTEREVVASRSRPRTFTTGRTSPGERTVEGQYVDDMKEGTWVYRAVNQKRTITWHKDLLEGPYEVETFGKVAMHLTFAEGRLTHFDGKPARNRLFDLMQAGEVDWRTASELRKSTTMDAVELPLADLVTMISDMHVLNVSLDPFHVSDPAMPITDQIVGIDLNSALTIVSAPRELGCDYRYGQIWITSAEDAEDWHDPTGVAGIQPAKGSELARAWNEPTATDPVNQPLAEALARAAQPLAIEIDTSALASAAEANDDFRVTARVGGLPFHHALGTLLYRTRCRCRLDGDSLVILPPAEE